MWDNRRGGDLKTVSIETVSNEAFDRCRAAGYPKGGASAVAGHTVARLSRGTGGASKIAPNLLSAMDDFLSY